MNITDSLHPRSPARILDTGLPDRAGAGISARASDLQILRQAPDGYLDTTHFDTVRFPPPDWALETFAVAATDGAMTYSGYRGHSNVLTEVARNLGDVLSITADPLNEIILSPGTQAGLFGTLCALVTPGQRVALATPDYLFSERILRFLGADVTAVPILWQDGRPPAPDLDLLEEEFATRGTRIFVFSNPNNPSGMVYDAETIAAIGRLAVTHGVTVVVDELYCRLLHDGVGFHHLRNQPGMAERTVTLLGPSKTESLSGYRIGVAVAPASIAADIETVQSITALRAPAYSQALLGRWLRDDREWLAARLPDFTALREMTHQALTQLPWLSVRKGAGTAYAWIDVSALGIPVRKVSELLLTDAGVLVSPGYQFGPSSDGHFRMCYARDETLWAAALERIVDVLAREGQAHGLPA